MTDYKEEQESELEALESIYVNELEIISTEPPTFTIEIPCEIRNVDPGKDAKEFSVKLKFKLPEEYPDVIPHVEFVETSEIDEDFQKTILLSLSKLAEDELGCVMVFTLVSEVQEKLNSWADEVYEKKLQEKEAKEKVPVFHGTIVTKENFMEWREKFIMERNMKKVKVITDKLTGKQIFMLKKDQGLELGDDLIGALEEDIEVDESLFNEELEDIVVSDSD